MAYSDFRDLIAFQKGFDLSMKIFQLSKNFPKEEKFSLTDQIRRSSRSVCANIEAYRKRRYKAHFISKLSDSDSENSETQVWLLFSKECDCINSDTFNLLYSQSREVGKLLTYMMDHPEKFIIPDRT
ncbi:four helix bundle protein [Dyadobacter psychrotolerans]|uniref:Four helix bundle protein n=1 Tax=Dyadobacter psychrotolerans TaxID=2541721 RepID=A0A4R5DSR6_9BACT|nr:four helix bundle protein [Dyadobacter psychrotolerans]TDE13913.1 four helix bundle protein [Dyadobacter psychrotolerans]